MIRTVLLFFGCFCIFTPTQSYAQRLEAGGYAGITYYMGDISDGFNSYNVGLGGHFTYNLHHKLGARLDLCNVSLSANEKYATTEYRRKRGYKFSFNYQELNLTGELRPFDRNQFTSVTSFKRTLRPYAVGGAGICRRINGSVSGPPDSQNQFPETNDTHKQFTYFIGGGGLRWHFAPRYKLSAEGTGRLYFSDYLDGISLHANPRSKDLGFFGYLTLTYILDVPEGVTKRSWFLL